MSAQKDCQIGGVVGDLLREGPTPGLSKLEATLCNRFLIIVMAGVIIEELDSSSEEAYDSPTAASQSSSDHSDDTFHACQGELFSAVS